jgi:hypothetical protein
VHSEDTLQSFFSAKASGTNSNHFAIKILRLKWKRYLIILLCTTFCRSRDSSVGIATVYGLDAWGVGLRVPVGSNVSFLRVVQTGSGAHPAFYQMGTGGYFPGGKAAGSWSWPLTSNYIHPLPHTLSCTLPYSFLYFCSTVWHFWVAPLCLCPEHVEALTHGDALLINIKLWQKMEEQLPG